LVISQKSSLGNAENEAGTEQGEEREDDKNDRGLVHIGDDTDTKSIVDSVQVRLDELAVDIGQDTSVGVGKVGHDSGDGVVNLGEVLDHIFDRSHIKVIISIQGVQEGLNTSEMSTISSNISATDEIVQKIDSGSTWASTVSSGSGSCVTSSSATPTVDNSQTRLRSGVSSSRVSR